jgi:hypothetical protein
MESHASVNPGVSWQPDHNMGIHLQLWADICPQSEQVSLHLKKNSFYCCLKMMQLWPIEMILPS